MDHSFRLLVAALDQHGVAERLVNVSRMSASSLDLPFAVTRRKAASGRLLSSQALPACRDVSRYGSCWLTK